MASERTPVLFLSGAGLGPWIWDAARASLDPGESAVAAYPRAKAATLWDYARAALDQAPWERFVVVAHSVGGAVAAEMCSQAPGRIAGLLGVCAMVPEPGRSFVGSLPLPSRLATGAVVRVFGTRPPEKTIRASLCTGLEGTTADRVVAGFDPESKGLYVGAVGTPRYPARRGYLFTTRDAGLPEGIQQRSARNLGAVWTAGMATGHLPMLADPESFNGALADFLEHGA